MYLAKHVAGRSLPKIRLFYNGRHHGYGTETTVSSAYSELIDVVASRTIQRLKEGCHCLGETQIVAATMTNLRSVPPSTAQLLIDCLSETAVKPGSTGKFRPRPALLWQA